MNHPLRWSAIVALEEPVMPSAEDLAAAVARSFPDAPALTPAGASENLLSFSIGDHTAAVTLVPTPIPASQLEGPTATAWYWPDAAEAFGRHTAHLLVTLIDEGGSAIDKSIRLTQLVSAAAETTGAVGIFWGPGRLVHQPAAFAEQAQQMSPDDLPLFLWVDFRVGQADEATVGLFTTGLAALGIDEIEVASFAGEPPQLISHTYNIAHYLLTSRKAVNDGQTIGVSEEEMATITRGPSMLDPELEVWRLAFEPNA